MFGAVKLTKYSDIDKYKYSGYGIAFDRKGKFSFGYGFGRNVIFLGVDMSSFVLVDNKKKFLILGQGIIQGLDDTTLSAEKMYSINFTENNKKFCLNSCLNKKLINPKQKIQKLYQIHCV